MKSQRCGIRGQYERQGFHGPVTERLFREAGNVKKKNQRKNYDPHFLDRSGFDGRRTGVNFVAHGQAVWARALLGRSNTSVADMNNSTPATARPE